MSVNSFDNYPMSFKPEKQKLTPPIYLSLANTLEIDILNGLLPPNTLLPPQRELADFLDINLGTVTRAYKICQLKGLIYSITGKGTFVTPNSNAITNRPPEGFFLSEKEYIELSMMKPFYSLNSTVLEAAQRVISRSNAIDLLSYSSPYGVHSHVQAAITWLNRFNLFPEYEQISFTSGAQNALNVVLATLFHPGDKIAVDKYTYPSFVGIANLLSIQVIPIKNDEYGMVPDELDKICKLTNIKGIYLMPSCSNPTSILLTMDRRRELAEIIKKRQLLIIEDEAYSFIAPPDYLPFASILPEQTIHINGLSKAISAGLRVAYIMYPEKFRTEIVSGLYKLNLNTPLLNIEIISELIISGEYETILDKKIKLSKIRNSIFKKYFAPFSNQSNPLSLFQCVKLPPNYNSKLYAVKARKQRIKVLDSTIFLVGDVADNPFIRLSICSPDSETELAKALKILSDLL